MRQNFSPPHYLVTSLNAATAAALAKDPKKHNYATHGRVHL